MKTRPEQWNRWALLPIAAGAWWLVASQDVGWLLLAALPAILLIAGGVAMFLWPGVDKTTQFASAGGALGALASVILVFDDAVALICGLLSAGSYLVAGRMLIRQARIVDGVPPPNDEPAMWFKAALDDTLLAYLSGTARIPGGPEADRLCEDLYAAESSLRQRGLLDHPERMHRDPPPPEVFELKPRRAAGQSFEQLSFPSDFVADPALPGAEAYEQLQNNATAAAWVLRHDGPPRPWLLCIHGYRMGVPWQDFGLYPPLWLHRHLGLNVLMPILPLHGPRREGWRSGDDYLDGNFAHMLHTHSQALWDVRRCAAWIRAQEPDARLGILGFSLGGYTAALVTQYEAGLDFAIACIPATDFASTLWRQVPPEHRRYYREQGVDEVFLRQVMHPVSPLVLEPKVAPGHRHIIAGVADRVVPPGEARKLASHWQVPVQWYQGGHLSFRREPIVRKTIEKAMRDAGWSIPTDAAG